MKRIPSVAGAVLGTCLVLLGTVSASTCCDELKAHLAPLSGSDFDRMLNAADAVMSDPAVGNIMAWRNPETGASGTVQFILRYRSEGNECRKVWYAFKLPADMRSMWEINVCKEESGWTLSQSPKEL